MALAPWSVVAAGKFRTDAEEEERRKNGEYRKMRPGWERNEREKKVSKVLEKIAGEVGTKHLTAGEFLISSWGVHCLILTLCSGDRISPAQSAVRVPNHRMQEGRAPPFEY
jgi:hypothetical protein